jgi:hypothetical protein
LSSNNFNAEGHLGFQQSGHSIQKPGGGKNRQKKAGHSRPAWQAAASGQSAREQVV